MTCVIMCHHLANSDTVRFYCTNNWYLLTMSELLKIRFGGFDELCVSWRNLSLVLLSVVSYSEPINNWLLDTVTAVIIMMICFSSFSVMKLPTQLEAHKVKLNVPNDSVFIYSPMNLPRKDSTTQLITQYGEESALPIYQHKCVLS